MDRSGYAESFVMYPEAVSLVACVQGAGAAPPVIPTTVLSLTSSKSYMSAANNFALAGGVTRTGVGQYGITIKDKAPVVLDLNVSIWGPSGTWGTVVDYNPTTRVATVLVFAAGGAAADLAATEFMRLSMSGQLSVFP